MTHGFSDRKTRPGEERFRGADKTWLTAVLFVEYQGCQDTYPVADRPYRLYRHTPGEQPCLQTEFLKLGDPHGYQFALKFFVSFDHFQHMLEHCKMFKEAYESYQDELFLKDKARAAAKIREIMENGETAQSLAAAKYLHSLATQGDGSAADGARPGKRGRPSKSEVKGELAKAIRADQQAIEDYRRMNGLTVITGGKAN